MKKNKKQTKNGVSSSFPKETDWSYFKPVQIEVFGNFDRAVKNFRSLVQSEKILATYKEKSRYEKPSEKKRRKQSEALQRVFEEEMKQKKILSGEYEKEKVKKQARKEQKMRTKSMRAQGNGEM